MQRTIGKLLFSVLLIAVVLPCATAHAAGLDLPAGMLIGDQNGIRVDTTGDYFIEAEALEPGDVITKRLVINNTEPYSYRLVMTAEPLEETGPLKLLDEVRCTIRLDGRVLYDGRIRGDEGGDMVRQALDLGSCPSGAQRTLDITLKVNPEMQKYYWTTSEALITWNFHAVQDTSSGNVKTGEVIDNALLIILLSVLLSIGIVLLIKKRQSENQETEYRDWEW